MAFTTARRTVLMLLMTPGLALLHGRVARASAKIGISPAPGEGSPDNLALARQGLWGPLFDLPNVAIHTHVLPNGKVLFWGRRDRPAGSMREQECTPYVWDPRTGQFAVTPPPRRADGTKVNLFCSGHAFLPDGRLLVVGGHVTDGDGLDQACAYDYRTNTWAALPVMNGRRWFPTVTALSDGTVLVSSGSYTDHGRIAINEIAQIWDGHQWELAPRFAGLPLYPRTHVAPDGRVFASAPDARADPPSAGDQAAWTALPWPRHARHNGEPQYGPSVMYDAGKVLHIGGCTDGSADAPTAAAEIIDLCAHRPAWREIAGMRFPRRQHNV
ncbi:MAG TPA: kelch repeat-containing protein, partial [Pseudonocardiaceae bacterium]|nr:kelch repeat-containing protein [Pseudonocardiaceae bacterium]